MPADVYASKELLDPARLVAVLDGLAVPDQRKLLIWLARTTSRGAALRRLVATWARAGTFERRWAAELAAETGQGEHLTRLIGDLSPPVRRAAVAAWSDLADGCRDPSERFPRPVRRMADHSIATTPEWGHDGRAKAYRSDRDDILKRLGTLLRTFTSQFDRKLLEFTANVSPVPRLPF